jgi:hypothetical protein
VPLVGSLDDAVEGDEEVRDDLAHRSVLPAAAAPGAPSGLAVAGHQLLISIVIGFAIDETGEFPHLTEAAGDVVAGGPDERFELLLDIFVDGLARRANSAPRPRSER